MIFDYRERKLSESYGVPQACINVPSFAFPAAVLDMNVLVGAGRYPLLAPCSDKMYAYMASLISFASVHGIYKPDLS